jgi:polyphenol oxidase
MSKQGFLLRESRGIHYYTCCAFNSVPQLRHGFSTRRGGSLDSHEGSFNLGYTSRDSSERVSENRRQLLSALDFGDAPLICLHQVHSDRVHIIENTSDQWSATAGDALATRLENVALAVQVADCLPVLIADPENNAVAAVHSGWRGTLAGILIQTIKEMGKAFGSDPSKLLLAIGPGIRSCCFEVGHDVAELFSRQYPESCSSMDQLGKYHLNLPQILDTQMDLAGVKPEHRFNIGACSRCNSQEFFSYRAEGRAAGRMLAIIGMSRPCHAESWTRTLF